MGLFDRWFRRNKDVPAWCSFFNEAQHREFLNLVQAELTSRSLTFKLNGDSLETVTADGKARTFGLTALAQRCHQTKVAEWPLVIGAHFRTLFSAEDEARVLMSRVTHFDSVKHALRVNLYGQRPPEVGAGRNLINFEIAEGLFGVLVFDFPTTTRSVSEADAEPWGMRTEDLIALAIKNTTTEPIHHERLELEGNADLTLLGGGFFTSSRILQMEKLVPVEHPYGALVSVPTRNTVLLHPIVNPKVVFALNAMVTMTRKIFHEGPGSVSPELFWWRQGQIRMLRTQIDNDIVRFAPPDSFMAVMAQLAQPN